MSERKKLLLEELDALRKMIEDDDRMAWPAAEGLEAALAVRVFAILRETQDPDELVKWHDSHHAEKPPHGGH